MICNSLAIVLFDYRATHSFILLLYFKSLNQKIKPIESRFLISTPSSKVFLIESMYRDYEVKIAIVALKADFLT